MIGRYKRIARTFDELRIGALASMNEAIPELRSPMDRPSDDDDGKEKPDILNDIGLLALRPHGGQTHSGMSVVGSLKWRPQGEHTHSGTQESFRKSA